LAVIGLVILGVGSAVRLNSPAKNPEEQIMSVAEATPPVAPPKAPIDFPVAIPWPAYGNAGYAVPKDQISVSAKKVSQPVPIASLAKIITALAIIEKKPLVLGQQGPSVPITEADIAIYEEYVRKSGTVLPIEVGTDLSQYQALQAIMMVSANNVSDTAAIWAFGSVDAYVTYANDMVRRYGLTQTTVSDASGFSPKTVSTPEDMAQLTALYMKHPVLRQIAQQEQANLPFAGVIRNYNSFANEGGLVGIKVGNTDEAGRCYIMANIRQTATGEELSVAVVLGASDFSIAAKDAEAILSVGDRGHDTLISKQP
jgi:D-alanyl-D-alanine carboxypeptidase (penicillin-binding protein 5/6)